MPLHSNLELEDVLKDSGRKTTKKAKPAKNDNSSFGTLIAVVVVFLVIVGVVFAYTRNNLTVVKKGSDEAAKMLNEQVGALKDQLNGLKDKAAALEAENAASQQIVADLFDKNRKLPATVAPKDWPSYTNDALGFKIQLPADFEVARVDNITAVSTDKKITPKPQSAVFIQPKDAPDYKDLITIKNDYPDFAELKLADKYALFKDLNFLDQKDFTGGKLLYFVDVNKDNKQIPTVLILTDKQIYRMSFNLATKPGADYVKYREDFEQMAVAFTVVAPAVKPEVKK
jgi:cation transport regulator ChaB